MKLGINNIIKPLFSLNQNALNEVNQSGKTIRHYISASEPNDYGQVLDPAKYVDKRYRNNPVVLFQHGTSDYMTTTSVSEQLKFLIGNNNKLYTEQVNGVNYLFAETAIDEDSEEAMDIFRLYAKKFLHAWSKWFFPIGKVSYDETNNHIIYDTWGIYEYSAVYIPVDGLAVGNETYENAMHEVHSDFAKNMLYGTGLQNRVKQDFNASDFKHELQLLKNEISAIQPGVTHAEVNSLLVEVFNKYTNELIPKIKEIHNSVNGKLIDFALKADVETTAKNAAAEIIMAFMGKTIK